METEMGLEDEEQQQPKRIKQFFPSQNHRSVTQDIMTDILLRLAVKCLLRCKSVCKSWHSLISDPHFVKSHLTLSTSHRLMFFSTSRNDYHHLVRISVEPITTLKSCPLYDVMHDKTINSIELDYPLKEALSIFGIVGYCHGLLCLNVGNEALFICNPSTRRYNRLPYSKIESHVYGFGYDESSEDYKVVVVSKSGTQGMIYSLKSGKWKTIGGFLSRFYLVDHNCKFSNGALHWKAVSEFDLSNTPKIVSLDLAKETYGEVKQPIHDGGYTYLSIGALGESLSLCYDYGGNRVDVWVMKVYGVQGSWTKLASIQNLTKFLRSSIQCPRPPTLCFANEGKILFTCDWKFVLYDIKDGTLSEIKNCDTCIQACVIVESLVSPDDPRRRSKRLG